MERNGKDKGGRLRGTKTSGREKKAAQGQGKKDEDWGKSEATKKTEREKARATQSERDEPGTQVNVKRESEEGNVCGARKRQKGSREVEKRERH